MKTILFYLSFFFALGVFGQSDTYFSTKDGAIKGYDPVAYFSESKPVKGDKAIATEWMGVTWYFATEENQKLFETNPERYAPQYGGYCAYGVAKGGLYKIEPEAWKIVDDKLYLNYSLKIQRDWAEDIPGYIDQADDNWPGLAKNK